MPKQMLGDILVNVKPMRPKALHGIESVRLTSRALGTNVTAIAIMRCSIHCASDTEEGGEERARARERERESMCVCVCVRVRVRACARALGKGNSWLSPTSVPGFAYFLVLLS
jgi:hypothetical protein